MTERPDVRRLVEAATGGDEEGPTFAAPWQARAFGLAVVLHDRAGAIDWTEFQSNLVSELPETDAMTEDDDPANVVEADYYEAWLRALERLAVERGWIDRDELEQRAVEFASGQRTAAEFVEGEHERGPDEPSSFVHR